ncbi:hypothetical protein [uncultured Corynebacterium sp.]|uniref:hypothetical protein n=1 Tax=uncultured Corynebacterium sp. TaxID=159447 RepID=UPI00262D6B1A|nr:hypothetical protein [uncultured Corynebacterium sp.]
MTTTPPRRTARPESATTEPARPGDDHDDLTGATATAVDSDSAADSAEPDGSTGSTDSAPDDPGADNPDDSVSKGDEARRESRVFGKLPDWMLWLLVPACLYKLIVAIGVIGDGFGALGEDTAEDLFSFASNPSAGRWSSAGPSRRRRSTTSSTCWPSSSCCQSRCCSRRCAAPPSSSPTCCTARSSPIRARPTSSAGSPTRSSTSSASTA